MYKEHSFTTFLLRYFLLLLLLLLSTLLFWIYHSTGAAIKHEQQLSIELNNRNSSIVLDGRRRILRNALNHAAHAFSDHHSFQTFDVRERLNWAVKSMENDLHFDLLRFISNDHHQTVAADSPFFNFDGADQLFSKNNERFLNCTHLLSLGSMDNRLWLLVTGERVVHEESGRVRGILIGGIVLNDNIPIVRDMLQRSDAEYATLMVGDQLVISNRTLPAPLLRQAENMLSSGRKNWTISRVRIEKQQMVISRHQYPLKCAQPLNIFLFYRDSLHNEVQQTMLRSGAVILVSTILLFVLFFQLSRIHISRAMNHLLAYTGQAAGMGRKTAYKPGILLEFNQVGKAVEKMLGRLDKADAELLEHRERLEFIINSAEIGTWDWDISNGNAVINDRFSEILGYAPGELKPHISFWEEKLHPDEKKEVMQAMADHIQGKTPLLNREIRLRHKSGRWIWVLDVGKVFKRDTEGRAVRVLGIHIDITKRKIAEQDLLKERALLLSMINSIPDLIFYKDRQSSYLGCNRAFEEFIGQRETAIIGKSDFDLVSPDFAKICHAEDQAMLELNKPQRSEKWISYPDGRRVLVDTLKTPFTGPDNENLGIIGISRDITRREKIEQKLADERELLAVTLRSIGDAVFTTDTDGNIVFLNKMAEELTGWSNEEAQGRPSPEIFPIISEQTEQPSSSPVLAVLKNGESSGLSQPVALAAKDGSRKTIANSAAPIRDRNRHLVGVVVVFRDVTHEQILEQEYLKAKKLESVALLAGGLAHDFNNILFAIVGNIELASFLVQDKDEEAATLLANAQKAAGRAEKLTKQLLTFSRGGDPVKDITSLPELIRDSADFILHGSKVVCSYQFADDLWLVDADSGQVGQVIQNMVINAKHAMPGGGTVEIVAANVDDPSLHPLLEAEYYVSITIHDRGEGIPRDIIDKIFDPYFTTGNGGHGLGLAICHSVITKHAGHLTVESEPGQGTTFTIYLPALPAADTHIISQQYATLPGDSARVIVMDDEEILLEVVKGLLSNLGHEGIMVTDGEQAISKYLELRDAGTPADIVIMDLTVAGGMGGEEAAARLLELDPEAKIIVASGYSTNPVMAKYQEYGFQAAIAKPFTRQVLDEVIRLVLHATG